MGAIYGSAAQVVVVLSRSCSTPIDQIHGAGRLEPASLIALERDDWVTRAWTYQEVANTGSIHFAAEGGGRTSVTGDQFFSAIGKATSDYEKAHGIDSFQLRNLLANLDSLVDLLADWKIAGYLDRSAYQVMSAMSRRLSMQPADEFDAMIGAISAAPSDILDEMSLQPAEHFMRACEAKGDYSFIYCDAPRGELPGRRWRPLAGPITPVLPWHTFGDGQSGDLYPTHLHLNNMCRMTPGTVRTAARQFIERWLQIDRAGSSADDITDRILERLRQAGFSGCGEHLRLESGYFFPQSAVTRPNDLFVVVAAGVRWAHGAPGLVLRQNGDEIHHFEGVGVFVGPASQAGDSVNIG